CIPRPLRSHRPPGSMQRPHSIPSAQDGATDRSFCPPRARSRRAASFAAERYAPARGGATRGDGPFVRSNTGPGTKPEDRRLSRNIGERRTRCPSTAAFRTTGRLHKAIDQTLSLALKEAGVNGRMVLFVASILSYDFFPSNITPSAAGETGLASVYSHE